MAATLILVRHAAHIHLDRVLSGRTMGVPLSQDGAAQAARLARRLARHLKSHDPIIVQTSPMERAARTAKAVAQEVDAPLVHTSALNEIDFGSWTGRPFSALEGDPEWDKWNSARATARPPGGESMAEAQARIVAHLHATARAHDGRTVVMVSHADMIRAAVAHVLGLELDNLLRFDIDPASATTLTWGDGWARVNVLNEREE